MKKGLGLTAIFWLLAVTPVDTLSLDNSPLEWELESIVSSDEIEQAHAQFAKFHGKPITAERLANFRANVKYAKEMNSKNMTYTLGVTEFADLSWEEFRDQFLQDESKLGAELEDSANMVGGIQYNAEKLEVEDVPKKVDWVKAGFSTPVKWQGQCGSCWAFATCVVLEAIAKQKTGKLVSLSPQQLISCEPMKGGKNACLGGGTALWANNYVIKNGIMLEEDYPYRCTDPESDECRDALATCKADKSRSISLVSGGFYARGEDSLVKALVDRPVAVAVHANKSWQLYKGGILDGTDCPNGIGTSNHLVTVMGYDPTRYGFKNSWGKNWGTKGFGIMKRGVNVCGVSNFVMKVTPAD